MFCFSGVECEDEVYSTRQLEARNALLKEKQLLKKLDSSIRPPLLEVVDSVEHPIILNQHPAPKIQIVKPQVVTASLFQFLDKSKKDKENIFSELVEEEDELIQPVQTQKLNLDQNEKESQLRVTISFKFIYLFLSIESN